MTGKFQMLNGRPSSKIKNFSMADPPENRELSPKLKFPSGIGDFFEIKSFWEFSENFAGFSFFFGKNMTKDAKVTTLKSQ